jgi:hypothetical protein
MSVHGLHLSGRSCASLNTVRPNHAWTFGSIAAKAGAARVLHASMRRSLSGFVMACQLHLYPDVWR